LLLAGNDSGQCPCQHDEKHLIFIKNLITSHLTDKRSLTNPKNRLDQRNFSQRKSHVQ
jgi:hypothetical protein